MPGSPLDPRAEGTNHLLREGVPICTSIEDVLESLARLRSGLRQGDLFSEPEPRNGVDEPLWDELNLGDVTAVPHAPAPRSYALPIGIGQGKPKMPSYSLEGAELDKSKPTSARVLGLLEPSPISIDELVRASDMQAQAIRAILLTLELGGRLERHGGNRVSLI